MWWVSGSCDCDLGRGSDLMCHFQEREDYKFTYLRKVMLSLLESRRELLGATLTQDQTLELQMKVISKIDWGNRWVDDWNTIVSGTRAICSMNFCHSTSTDWSKVNTTITPNVTQSRRFGRWRWRNYFRQIILKSTFRKNSTTISDALTRLETRSVILNVSFEANSVEIRFGWSVLSSWTTSVKSH